MKVKSKFSGTRYAINVCPTHLSKGRGFLQCIQRFSAISLMKYSNKIPYMIRTLRSILPTPFTHLIYSELRSVINKLCLGKKGTRYRSQWKTSETRYFVGGLTAGSQENFFDQTNRGTGLTPLHQRSTGSTRVEGTTKTMSGWYAGLLTALWGSGATAY